MFGKEGTFVFIIFLIELRIGELREVATEVKISEGEKGSKLTEIKTSEKLTTGLGSQSVAKGEMGNSNCGDEKEGGGKFG